MNEFSHFYVKVELWILRSILVSLCKHGRRGSGALVVNNGSGMHFPGFADKGAPRAVFPAMAARSACTPEKCAQSMLRLSSFTGNCGHLL